MNGWKAYCTFCYRGAIARTSSAALYIWQGANPSQKNSDLDAMIRDFYNAKPYLHYGWGCPLCGEVVYGTTYCTYCGFNPYTFYYNYYGVELNDAGYYYIGDDYYTPLDNLTPAPIDTVYSWACPVCGYEHSMATNCPVCGSGYT